VHLALKTNGALALESRNDVDLFTHLARTVVGQQLSNAAASTIWSRIEFAASDRAISVLELCTEKNTEILKSCGLSRFKVKALLGLRFSLEDETISEKVMEQASHPELVDHLTQLWGFGRWSADMTAIFYFGLEDVWSSDDVSLMKGLRVFSDNDLEIQREILETVSPYKSYFSMHVWKAVDDKII